MNTTPYSRFHSKVLPKFADTICMFFYNLRALGLFVVAQFCVIVLTRNYQRSKLGYRSKIHKTLRRNNCKNIRLRTETGNRLRLGLCIMEHLNVLEYSGFISNPEYLIPFGNTLLGAKWADRVEVWNAIRDHTTC